MIIHNITFNIDDNAHQEWLDFMQAIFIPKMLHTKKFIKATMTRVLVEEEMGGQTYSVQFWAENQEMLDRYRHDDEQALLGITGKFAGKMVMFSTDLEVVSEQQVH